MRYREPRPLLRRLLGSRRVAFFADHEQQRQSALAGFEQAFGGLDHGGGDALGVARAAPPDEFVVFARRHEGRDGIDVRGKRDTDCVTELREHVEPVRFHGHPFDAAAEARRQRFQVLAKELGHALLSERDGFDIDECPREFEDVHKMFRGEAKEKKRRAEKTACFHSR